MLAAMRKFRAGKWEQLWNESIKTADKIKAKKGRKPDQARMRTDRQKDDYAQKCADAGNLSKANKIICQELLQACADDTILQLRLLHPHGDLDFDRNSWPSREDTRAFWAASEAWKLSSSTLALKRSGTNFQAGRDWGPLTLTGGEVASTLPSCSRRRTQNSIASFPSTSSCPFCMIISSLSTPLRMQGGTFSLFSSRRVVPGLSSVATFSEGASHQLPLLLSRMNVLHISRPRSPTSSSVLEASRMAPPSVPRSCSSLTVSNSLQTRPGLCSKLTSRTLSTRPSGRRRLMSLQARRHANMTVER